MKVITWNVNGIRAVLQKGLLEFVQKFQPDILCLQETKAHPEQIEGAESLIPGYKGYWSAAQRAGYSGTATFCKESPVEVQRGFGIPKFDAEGRMVVTRFEGFTVFNVYFPNGGSGQERHDFKQEFLRKFGEHLKKCARQGENIILVGDYNVAYLDSDVYDPVELATESGFLPEERQWMKDFLAAGFIDTFRQFHSNEHQRYTWWSYKQNARMMKRGWRIDHICVSQGLKNKVKSAQIFESEMGSDHCPVIADFDL